IGGRSADPYLVSDVHYRNGIDSPFGQVTFSLTRVRRSDARQVTGAPSPSQRSVVAEEGTYVTDITHYLDEAGELMRTSGPARKLASFLTLLIDEASGAASADAHDSGVRCRTKACRG